MGEYAEAYEQHGSMKAAAQAMGVPPTTFHDRLAKERGGKAPKIPRERGSRGITAEELLLKHSSEHKILHAANAIPQGTFHPESEFIHSIGITGGYKHIVEREEFSVFRGKAPGSMYYWGHPTSVASMKADGVLR